MDSGRIQGGGFKVGAQVNQPELKQTEFQPPVRMGNGFTVEAKPGVRYSPEAGHVESKGPIQSAWKIEKNETVDEHFKPHEKIYYCLELDKDEYQAYQDATPAERKKMYAHLKGELSRSAWKSVVNGRLLTDEPSHPPSTGSGLSLTSPKFDLSTSGAGLNTPGMGLSTSGAGLKMPGIGLDSSGAGLRTPGVGLNTPDLGIGTSGFGLDTSDVESPEFGVKGQGLDIKGPRAGLDISDVKVDGPKFGVSGGKKKGFLKRLFSRKSKGTPNLDDIAAKLKAGKSLSKKEQQYLNGLGDKERQAFMDAYDIKGPELELGLTPKLSKGARVKNAFRRFGRKLYNFFIGKPITKFVKWGSKYGVKHFSSWDDKNKNNLYEASAHLSGLKKDGQIVDGDMDPHKLSAMQVLMVSDADKVADVARNSEGLKSSHPAMVQELDARFALPEAKVNTGGLNVGNTGSEFSLGGGEPRSLDVNGTDLEVDVPGGSLQGGNIQGPQFGVEVESPTVKTGGFGS